MIDYSLFQTFERLFKPVRSRIANLIQRGIIHQVGESGLQVSLGEEDTQENIHHSQHFGFASRPPSSSEVLILFPNGERRTGFAVSSASVKGCPVTLKDGESVQYNDEGSSIALRNGGKLEIRNRENELISAICELADKMDSMSAYLVNTGTCPSGACTFLRPKVELSSVIKKLQSFRN